MAQSNELEIEDTALVLTHATDTDGVAAADITIQTGLGTIRLVKHLDGGFGRRRTSQGLGVGGVLPKSLADFLG